MFDKNAIIMLIGAKLKKLREQKRYSQKEMANILGISQKTYSNIESDKSKITIEQLAVLSKKLDFDFIDFLQEHGVNFNQSYNNFSDNSSGVQINTFPEKLVKQMELRLQEKDEFIRLLKEQLEFYKNQ